jgi:hypothetical protein
MAEDNVCPSHLDITIAVGTNLLVIAPFAFDVHPVRGDSGVIYCKISFEAPWCKGGVHDVFVPKDFQNLLRTLDCLAKAQPASVTVTGLEVWFRLEGSWNAEQGVAVFKATMPARPTLGDWSYWYERAHRPVGMSAGIELEFWMEPASLEEPLVEVAAVLEHARSLRRAFAVQDVFDVDEE